MDGAYRALDARHSNGVDEDEKHDCHEDAELEAEATTLR